MGTVEVVAQSRSSEYAKDGWAVEERVPEHGSSDSLLSNGE